MAKYRKKAIIVTAYRADQDQFITTLEGVSEAKHGDYIVNGVDNEQWAVKPEWFNGAYTHIRDDKYQRNPQTLDAVQIDKPETTKAPTGDIKGSVGDWKVTGKSGEQWFVKPDIFDKTYERVGNRMDKGMLAQGHLDKPTGLQKAVDQIGIDAVRKAIPMGYRIGFCQLHGAYMIPPSTEPCCPVCPSVPKPNGTDATEVSHYIDMKPVDGTNPGQKINPYGV